MDFKDGEMVKSHTWWNVKMKIIVGEWWIGKYIFSEWWILYWWWRVKSNLNFPWMVNSYPSCIFRETYAFSYRLLFLSITFHFDFLTRTCSTSPFAPAVVTDAYLTRDLITIFPRFYAHVPICCCCSCCLQLRRRYSCCFWLLVTSPPMLVLVHRYHCCCYCRRRHCCCYGCGRCC